jgi:hypothetical protein
MHHCLFNPLVVLRAFVPWIWSCVATLITHLLLTKYLRATLLENKTTRVITVSSSFILQLPSGYCDALEHCNESKTLKSISSACAIQNPAMSLYHQTPKPISKLSYNKPGLHIWCYRSHTHSASGYQTQEHYKRDEELLAPRKTDLHTVDSCTTTLFKEDVNRDHDIALVPWRVLKAVTHLTPAQYWKRWESHART